MFHHRLAAFLVVVGRELTCRRQHLFDRRVEPLPHGSKDNVAADEEDEERRHQRHAEEDEDQLGAEPGERNGAPPLDEQLDDVAGEDEDQRQQHHHVDR